MICKCISEDTAYMIYTGVEATFNRQFHKEHEFIEEELASMGFLPYSIVSIPSDITIFEQHHDDDIILETWLQVKTNNPALKSL